MVGGMRINLPGLLVEKTPSGATRYRVRVKGRKKERITLPLGPDHPAFSEHYYAARSGLKLPKPEENHGIGGSIGWMVSKYQAHMAEQVKAGELSPSTQSYRVRHTDILRTEFGAYKIDMPTSKLVDLRDTMIGRPGAADTFIKSVRALYLWGMERGHAKVDPTAGIRRLSKSPKGARPWSVVDLKTFRQYHKPGTMAHLYITLLMFTACRISDAVLLGRKNETIRRGEVWLEWQPEKAGSPHVSIPMAPQLLKATRSQVVQGEAYLLNAHGRPFASKKALANRFAKWVTQAGLEGLSSHGVRKAAGALLADAGVSQHTIMAIHGHSEAQTSEIYTKAANRRHLAQEGITALSKIAW